MPIPFLGQEIIVYQPDGSHLRVRAYGDQHRVRYETLGGVPIVKEQGSSFYRIAAPGYSDAASVEETAAVDRPRFKATGSLQQDTVRNRIWMESGLTRGKLSWEKRWEGIRQERLAKLIAIDNSVAICDEHAICGSLTGLCLLIDFPDVPASIPFEEIDKFCNKTGYKGFENNGSVYDYFYDVSAGRLKYNNIVLPFYYTARNERAHYTNPHVKYGDRAYELIKESLDDLKSTGFDFSRLSKNEDDLTLRALNVFYAGKRINNPSEGLWPHNYSFNSDPDHEMIELMDDMWANDYQISDIGDELSLGTFCHENGHMLCKFPDLYDTDSYASSGVGYYCLMGHGQSANPKRPTQICGYLKYRAGWVTKLLHSSGRDIALTSGQLANELYMYSNRNKVGEYFIIENRHAGGWDADLPASGLAIWHVDEWGSNDYQQGTPLHHYECALVQADKKLDLEQNPEQYGDDGDLFFSTDEKNRICFNDWTRPSSRWWDGSFSNLNISNISCAGSTMTFDVEV